MSSSVHVAIFLAAVGLGHVAALNCSIRGALHCLGLAETCSLDTWPAFRLATGGASNATVNVCGRGLACSSQGVCITRPSGEQVGGAFRSRYGRPCAPADTLPCAAATAGVAGNELYFLFVAVGGGLECREGAGPAQEVLPGDSGPRCLIQAGRQVVGYPCIFDDECSTKTCNSGGFCDFGTLAAGQSCNTHFDECNPTAHCAAVDSGTAKCVPNSVGAACGLRQCVEGLQCRGGSCVHDGGQSCDPQSPQCALGFYCEPSAKACTAQRAEGATCGGATPDECAVGLYCGAAGTCKPLPAAGEPCTDDGQCGSDPTAPTLPLRCGTAPGRSPHCFAPRAAPEGTRFSGDGPPCPVHCESGVAVSIELSTKGTETVCLTPGKAADPDPYAVLPAGTACVGSPNTPLAETCGCPLQATIGKGALLVTDTSFANRFQVDKRSLEDLRAVHRLTSGFTNSYPPFGWTTAAIAAPDKVCKCFAPHIGSGARVDDLVALGVPACALDSMVLGNGGSVVPNANYVAYQQQACVATLRSLCGYTYPNGYRIDCDGAGRTWSSWPRVVAIAAGGAAVVCGLVFASRAWKQRRPDRASSDGQGLIANVDSAATAP